MKLSKSEILKAIDKWNGAWDTYDLDGVVDLFHENVLFVNWTGGRAEGKENVRGAWKSWFENNGGFKFTVEDLFVDEEEQKVLYRWRLDWPSTEPGFENAPEVRYGADVMHFENGKVTKKLTYSKTTLEISGKRVRLTAKK
jgi:ketosteroid isomerase-like protein